MQSIGIYMPTRRESNWEKAEQLGFARGFLEHKLGVVQRAIKETDESNSDLCVRAFDDLRQKTSLPIEQIQLLVVVTQHPEFKVPHAAAVVHNRLGLAKHCMTFDVSHGCAGFTHGVTIVTGVMETARLDHAVLITCDPYSDKVDPQSKDTALLFGDAATATYFTRTGPGYVLIDSNFGTLPDSYRCLLFRDCLEMDGGAVFKHACKKCRPACPKCCKETISRWTKSICSCCTKARNIWSSTSPAKCASPPRRLRLKRPIMATPFRRRSR